MQYRWMVISVSLVRVVYYINTVSVVQFPFSWNPEQVTCLPVALLLTVFAQILCGQSTYYRRKLGLDVILLA